jgi:hypothetical protein
MIVVYQFPIPKDNNMEHTCGCCGKYAKGKEAQKFIDPDYIIRTQQVMELDGKNFLQLLLPEIPNSKVSYILMMFCPDCAKEIKKAMPENFIPSSSFSFNVSISCLIFIIIPQKFAVFLCELFDFI